MFDLNERVEVGSLLKFMKFSMTINLTTTQTINHIIRLSHDQWSLFMSNKDRWMGNFYQDDDVAT